MKMRVRSIGMLLAVVLACMSLMGARAQDATPDAVDMGASPVASPEAVAGCDTILGIGSTGDTCLILIQASEDAGDLDLYIDGLKAVESLTFTNVSGYFALPAGSHDFALVPAGETTDAALMTDDFATEAGTAYELAVVGTSDDLQLLVNPVDLSPLPPGTSGTPLENTRVRVIHAVPDAPAVNISVIAGDIAERVFTDLTYPQPSGTPISLRTTATGGNRPLFYRYWYRKRDGAWTIIRDYSTSNSCTWIPLEAGLYTVVVWVTDDTGLTEPPIAGMTCTITP